MKQKIKQKTFQTKSDTRSNVTLFKKNFLILYDILLIVFRFKSNKENHQLKLKKIGK